MTSRALEQIYWMDDIVMIDTVAEASTGYVYISVGNLCYCRIRRRSAI